MSAHAASLVACHECDALQRLPEPAAGVVRCVRCGALIAKRIDQGLDRAIAMLTAAVPVLALANLFPIVSVDLQGNRSEATLLGAVFALQGQGVSLVAWLVAITTLIVPALDIAMLLYLAMPLRLGMRPRGFATVFRFSQAVRPWGMIEVFLLGVLVSLVKLSSLATVVPGIALWSFGALMVLLVAANNSIDAHELWERAEALA